MVTKLPLRGKKILITGALGNIGSELIRNLTDNVDRNVTILDNLGSRRYPSLFNLPKEFKFKFLKEDILTADFNKHLKDIDIVIHLAAIINSRDYHKTDKEAQAVNFNGLKRVADACLTNNVALFFPSTTSLYAGQNSLIDETTKEIYPQSPYAKSKFDSEQILKKLGENGLKYVICRFGTIFGHSIGIHYDTAVNKFVWQAINEEPLTVWKTAWNQKRPYLYIGDAIKAINFIVKKDLFDGQIYNIVTKNYTVRDIVQTIKKQLPNLRVVYINSPIMNKLSYGVDDTKFRSQGFVPNGKIEIGVSSMINTLKRIHD